MWPTAPPESNARKPLLRRRGEGEADLRSSRLSWRRELLLLLLLLPLEPEFLVLDEDDEEDESLKRLPIDFALSCCARVSSSKATRRRPDPIPEPCCCNSLPVVVDKEDKSCALWAARPSESR